MLPNQWLDTELLKDQLWAPSLKLKAIGLAGFLYLVYSRVKNNYELLNLIHKSSIFNFSNKSPFLTFILLISKLLILTINPISDIHCAN